MMSFSLRMTVDDDEGEPTGEWVYLATVAGDVVTGPLAQGVMEILRREEVQVIALGPVLPLDWGKPWLVALALGQSNDAFWRAGVARTGSVVAFCDDFDEEIGVPAPWSRLFESGAEHEGEDLVF